jgi:hypothetical protein
MTITLPAAEFDAAVANATLDQVREFRQKLYRHGNGLSDAERDRYCAVLANREQELRGKREDAKKGAAPKVAPNVSPNVVQPAKPVLEQQPAPSLVPFTPTTFTGRKFDLLRAVRMDRTVSDYAYRVMSVIVDHLNERSERTKLSDKTIGFETSSYSRKVRRARQNLHNSKWLTWTHTRDANIYSVNWGTAKPFLAQLEKYRAAKREKFNKIEDNLAQVGHQCPTSHGIRAGRTPVS